MTASIGVSLYESEDTLTGLIYRVDTAMYAAKNEGKNRVVFR